MISALLLALTACQGVGGEQTAEQVQSRLGDIAALFPSTETGDITVGQDQNGGFTAFIDLTWNEEVGRYPTQRAIDQYSLDFAATADEQTPSLSSLTLSWTVPYHSDTEPAIEVAFQKKKEGLEQVEIKDRFTDNTFGADPFTVSPRTNTGGRPSEGSTVNIRQTATLPLSEKALASMHVPHHKVLRLPVSYAPRHKAYRERLSFLPRHKSGPTVLIEDLQTVQSNAAGAGTAADTAAGAQPADAGTAADTAAGAQPADTGTAADGQTADAGAAADGTGTAA